MEQAKVHQQLLEDGFKVSLNTVASYRQQMGLDMAFDEDSNRTRQGYSASNLAIIRHIALNLIKKEKTSIRRQKSV